MDRRQGAARPFRRKYRRADILLLAEVDELHGTLSGPATRKLCERAWKVFGDARFERLAGISNGHVYNLRRSRPYDVADGLEGGDAAVAGSDRGAAAAATGRSAGLGAGGLCASGGLG